MLRARPGAYMWIGNGTGSQGGCMVHNPGYDFNDAVLPIGAAYFTDVFKIKLWGPINVGLVFALSEFIVAWGIAWVYARRANTEFDTMAAEINRAASSIGGTK